MEVICVKMGVRVSEKRFC